MTTVEPTNPPDGITTRCPACGQTTLFIGSDGGLICSWLKCPEPSLQGEIENLRAALENALVTLIAIAAQPATMGRIWAENPTLSETLARTRAALRQHAPADPLRRSS